VGKLLGIALCLTGVCLVALQDEQTQMKIASQSQGQGQGQGQGPGSSGTAGGAAGAEHSVLGDLMAGGYIAIISLPTSTLSSPFDSTDACNLMHCSVRRCDLWHLHYYPTH
jgi:hypothetical protein